MGRPHVVFISGGRGSFEVACRVQEKHGTNVDYLFADTLIEDEELYEFLQAIEVKLQINILRLSDGRTPIQVFEDVGFLGNSLVDPCSKILKRDLFKTYLTQNYSKGTNLYFGIGAWESHRTHAIEYNWGNLGYNVDFPLMWEPVATHKIINRRMQFKNIHKPRLYFMGFKHNNCGGACVKAGEKQWKLLLEKFPDRFAMWENAENNFRDKTGKDVSFLSKTIKGKKQRLTLKQVRESWDHKHVVLTELDAQCSCFIGEEQK